MTESGLVTECPNCQTRFRVNKEQLDIANGRVRCGACLSVFDGESYLLGDTGTQEVAPAPNRSAGGLLETMLAELARSNGQSHHQQEVPQDIQQEVPQAVQSRSDHLAIGRRANRHAGQYDSAVLTSLGEPEAPGPLQAGLNRIALEAALQIEIGLTQFDIFCGSRGYCSELLKVEWLQ